MEQSQVENYIKLFLKGNISVIEEKLLLDWIKQSPENKEKFLYLQKYIGDELKTHPDKNSTLHWEQLLRRIMPEKTDESRVSLTSKRIFRLGIPIAASFLIGFSITTLFFLNRSKFVKMAVTEQRIVTPYGARTQFMLPDSSMVWLNSGSELLFPSQFVGKRPVILKGEAYFEVKKSKTPFVVSTIYGEIEVKGTSFDVKAYTDDVFETTLVNGNVHILTENKEEVDLKPGYQAVYSEKSIKVNPIDTHLFTSWIEGKLIFKEENLTNLIKKLERWYNVKIVLENDARLNEISYTGTIEMETFSEVLNLLCVTAPVGYTWNEKMRAMELFYLNKGTK
jgi:transmembrane sensor